MKCLLTHLLNRGPADLDLLPASERLSAEELKRNLTDTQGSSIGPQRILDVRPKEQFDIAHLPGAL